jgi:hypothetical protein
VTPVKEKSEGMKDKRATHCSYMTTDRMYKGRERELCFPLEVSVSYQSGDKDKHSEVVRGYVACEPDDRTPTQVERRYRNWR